MLKEDMLYMFYNNSTHINLICNNIHRDNINEYINSFQLKYNIANINYFKFICINIITNYNNVMIELLSNICISYNKYDVIYLFNNMSTFCEENIDFIFNNITSSMIDINILKYIFIVYKNDFNTFLFKLQNLYQ